MSKYVASENNAFGFREGELLGDIINGVLLVVGGNEEERQQMLLRIALLPDTFVVRFEGGGRTTLSEIRKSLRGRKREYPMTDVLATHWTGLGWTAFPSDPVEAAKKLFSFFLVDVFRWNQSDATEARMVVRREIAIENGVYSIEVWVPFHEEDTVLVSLPTSAFNARVKHQGRIYELAGGRFNLLD